MMMDNQPRLDQILFLDIETVPQYESYEQAPEGIREIWDKKAGQLDKTGESSPSEMYEQAGIYAEHGKIVVIGVGFFARGKFRVKSLKGDDEATLLEEFSQLLENGRNSFYYLCGHNSKEFDFPYLCRRMLVQGVKLPPQLQLWGKKPWEIKHIDTMDLWKFGDWKSFTSLHTLATIFNVPTSKDDIDGSQVREVYYQEEGGLDRIATYCSKDVVLTARVYQAMMGLPVLEDENIHQAT